MTNMGDIEALQRSALADNHPNTVITIQPQEVTLKTTVLQLFKAIATGVGIVLLTRYTVQKIKSLMPADDRDTRSATKKSLLDSAALQDAAKRAKSGDDTKITINGYESRIAAELIDPEKISVRTRWREPKKKNTSRRVARIEHAINWCAQMMCATGELCINWRFGGAEKGDPGACLPHGVVTCVSPSHGIFVFVRAAWSIAPESCR